MSVVIPITPGVPLATFSSKLDGVSYNFRLVYNGREGLFRISIATVDGAAIQAGRKIVTGFDLLRGNTHAARPPGLLMAIDTEGGDLDPGLDDLGGRVLLVYTPEAEL
ncbi:MAG: hypothetical protein JRD89_01445 [Deltaproteobacteria bacterium]|nr:hypothetical protein [Deltaproteobacteria bacterium]